MREALGTIAGYALLAPFAHIAAAIALAPLLFFTKKENRTGKGLITGLVLCVIWWAVCLGAVEFAQFAQAPETIGLFSGAAANIAFVWVKTIKMDSYSPSIATAWLAVYLTPAIGWTVGSLLK